MKTKKKSRSATIKKRSMEITVYCIDGPCKGKTFRTIADKEVMSVVTPEDPFCSVAYYKITKQVTHLGELIAIYIKSIERKKK